MEVSLLQKIDGPFPVCLLRVCTLCATARVTGQEIRDIPGPNIVDHITAPKSTCGKVGQGRQNNRYL